MSKLQSTIIPFACFAMLFVTIAMANLMPGTAYDMGALDLLALA